MENVFFTKDFDKGNLKNHIIFICDHATNRIPKSMDNLGLEKKNINSHIAYDIGARNLSIELSKSLDQTCFLSNFSRLVIDPNRKTSDTDLIVSKSFEINIPGNYLMTSEEKDKRIKEFYDPYHFNLLKLVKKKVKIFNKVFLISIHSFTKSHFKFDRGVEVGLLWNRNMNLLLPIQKELVKKKIHFGRNFPYSGFHYNFTLDRINQKFSLDNISIEIRNDLICSKKGITNYVKLLSKIFKEFLYDQAPY